MSVPKEMRLSREEDLKAVRYYKALAESVAEKYGEDSGFVIASLKGLAKAIYKFNPEAKFKFSTYATYFMNEACEKRKEPPVIWEK